MALKKNIFDQYTKDRESPELAGNASKKKYTHNKPFSTISNNPIIDSDTSSDELLKIDPEDISNWEFHDRPDSELGDLKSLADDMVSVGQQQPCVVRPTSKIPGKKYELIIGERRWRAATLAKIDLLVILKNNLTDSDAALSQAAENDNRLDISDYAKGMSFSKLIDDGVIKQKDLIERLGKSKQYVSALLSYNKIPAEVVDAIGDLSKVKYFAAEKIKQLANKGDTYKKALISIGQKISSKKYSANVIEREVSKIIQDKAKPINYNERVLTKNGRHIFTWRSDNNNLPSLHFPKQIVSLIESGDIPLSDLTDKFKLIIEEKLNDIDNQKSD